MLDLTPQALDEVAGILARMAPACDAYAFGSRVHGKARKFSDLDIALVNNAPIDWQLLERIREAFSASDLPFKVDVVDWSTVTPLFREEASRHWQLIRQKS